MSKGQRVLSAAVRARFGVFAAWTLLWSMLFYSSRPLNGDWWVFQSGARIFSGIGGRYWADYPGGPLHLYTSTPKLQVGPPAFLLSIPSLALSPELGRQVMAGLLAAAGLLVIALIEHIARQAGRAVDRVRRLSLVGGILLLPIWCTLAVAYMHLDDVMVMVLLGVALVAALRGRGWWMGVILGCAIATKPWAVGFLPLVMMLPSSQARRRSGLIAAGVALLWWLPFLIAAPATLTATSDIGVSVEPMSFWALLGVHVEPSAGREIQLGLTLIACALVVARGRWWAAPVVATAVRVGVDWQTWSYYGAALVACALLCDAGDPRIRKWPRVTVCALAAALVVPLAETVAVPTSVAAVVRLALLVSTAWLAIARRPRVTPIVPIDASPVSVPGSVLQQAG